MTKIVNKETAGKERRRLVRLIGFAIRELNSQQDISEETKDLSAFIALTLIAIHGTIDGSVEAWEKRGYWLKADRYRMEWAWTLMLGNQIKDSLLKEDWGQVAALTMSVAEKLGNINIPKSNQSGKFWDGAMNVLIQSG